MLRMSQGATLSAIFLGCAVLWSLPVRAESSQEARFQFPPPDSLQNLSKQTLWATWYYLPQMKASVNGGDTLFGVDGKPIGVTLNHHDYCEAAMEGSVRILSGDQSRTYNWAGKAPNLSVDCTDTNPNHPNGGKIFWRLATGPFGDGADRGQGLPPWILVPFRSLAVDPTVIPFETVLYIPSARGTELVLPNGDSAIHDGYFIATDRGTTIRNNHVDVFLGSSSENPFSFVGSDPDQTFRAYIVNTPSIVDALRAASRP